MLFGITLKSCVLLTFTIEVTWSESLLTLLHSGRKRPQGLQVVDNYSQVEKGHTLDFDVKDKR